MAKAFGILAVVLGVWAAAEITLRGLDDAFGGIFASGPASVQSSLPGDPPRSRAAMPELARERVEQAHRDAQARREAALGR